jgi:hypothetical protein
MGEKLAEHASLLSVNQVPWVYVSASAWHQVAGGQEHEVVWQRRDDIAHYSRRTVSRQLGEKQKRLGPHLDRH